MNKQEDILYDYYSHHPILKEHLISKQKKTDKKNMFDFVLLPTTRNPLPGMVFTTSSSLKEEEKKDIEKMDIIH